MTDSPSVVLLTGHDVAHRHVARALAEGPGLAAIVSVQPSPRSRWQRFSRARRRFGLPGIVGQAVARGLATGLPRLLPPGPSVGEVLGTGPFPAGVRNHIVPSTNGDATLKLLEGLEPDVLCVYGTAIVSDRLLARARRVALNLHTGISPRYRGADCYFWPLVRDEPQYVGATVHVCTSDIDGGHIYSTARARLEPDDGVRALFARTVAVGAELYAQVVTDILSGVATATPQELTHGVEYRVAMRTWRHELAVWVKLRRGLVRDYVAAGQPAEWNCEPSR